MPFDNGVHTIYVNGAYRGNDAIRRLMSDFCLSNADEMYYSEIAERVRFHKARREKAVEVAKKLLQDGSMPLERIADIADLPLQQIQQLAEQVKA